MEERHVRAFKGLETGKGKHFGYLFEETPKITDKSKYRTVSIPYRFD
jgi:hypothetical protein